MTDCQWTDITREWTTAPLYPGDPEPRLEKISDMHFGDVYNNSVLHACVHTGTHMDAPCHFFENGDDVTAVPLSVGMGNCIVIEANGVLVGEQLEKYLWMTPPRILFKGRVHLSQSAAFVLVDAGVKLVGVEGTSVAPPDSEAEVHRLLLSSGVTILEGLDLSDVRAGQHELLCLPMKIAGADGAPVRALLRRI